MKNENVCINMIVRDEGQFLEPCLRQVAPYVNRVLIAVDNRSVDNTANIVRRLANEFSNISVEFFDVGKNWQQDLLDIQNKQLKKRKPSKGMWIRHVRIK